MTKKFNMILLHSVQSLPLFQCNCRVLIFIEMWKRGGIAVGVFNNLNSDFLFFTNLKFSMMCDTSSWKGFLSPEVPFATKHEIHKWDWLCIPYLWPDVQTWTDLCEFCQARFHRHHQGIWRTTSEFGGGDGLVETLKNIHNLEGSPQGTWNVKQRTLFFLTTVGKWKLISSEYVVVICHLVTLSIFSRNLFNCSTILQKLCKQNGNLF